MIVLSANTESVADHFSILLQILAAQVDFSIGGRIHAGQHGDRCGLSASILDEIISAKKTGPSKVKI